MQGKNPLDEIPEAWADVVTACMTILEHSTLNEELKTCLIGHMTIAIEEWLADPEPPEPSQVKPSRRPKRHKN